jgi:hypothetical protein
MGRKILLYSAVLIGGFLLVKHATAGGQLIGSTTNGSANLVRAFQGR